jgi:hypothetical protein
MHWVLLCQSHFSKLDLIEILYFITNQRKIFILRGILVFHVIEKLLLVTPPYCNQMYIEWTENKPLDAYLQCKLSILVQSMKKCSSSNNKEHHSVWYSLTNCLVKCNNMWPSEKNLIARIYWLVAIENK